MIIIVLFILLLSLMLYIKKILKFEFFNETIFGKNMKKIYLGSCGLTSFDQTVMDQMSNVEILSIRGNQIERLDIVCPYTLSVFDCSYNQLDKIENIKGEGLLKMNASNNKIKTIITSGMPMLRSIDISDNFLLSGTISSETIILNQNKITDEVLNDIIFDGDRLKNLFINNNQIKGISKGLFSENLECLYLNGNIISYIHPDAFYMNGNLIELYLDSNKIQKIPETIFKGTPNIEIISISYNEISEFPLECFNNLNRLKSFICCYNPLKQVPKALLSGMYSLMYLDLMMNQLSESIKKELKKKYNSGKLMSI